MGVFVEGESWLLRPPSGARIIDSGAARWWVEDGILYNQSYARFVTAAHLRSGFAAARELSGAKPTPLVAEAGPLGATTREARALLSGPEAAATFSAMGVLVRSPVARTIMSFFVRLDSPPFPMRIFGDASEARAWARSLANAEKTG